MPFADMRVSLTLGTGKHGFFIVSETPKRWLSNMRRAVRNYIADDAETVSWPVRVRRVWVLPPHIGTCAHYVAFLLALQDNAAHYRGKQVSLYVGLFILSEILYSSLVI